MRSDEREHFPGVGAFYHLKWTCDGAFERLFGSGRGQLEQLFSKTSDARGIARGLMLKLRFDRYISLSPYLWSKTATFRRLWKAQKNSQLSYPEFPTFLRDAYSLIPASYEVSYSGYTIKPGAHNYGLLIKPRNLVKQRTDTKTQWKTSETCKSLFFLISL